MKGSAKWAESIFEVVVRISHKQLIVGTETTQASYLSAALGF